MFKVISTSLRKAFDSPTSAAVVFPVSHPVGISVIRCLGRNGVPVIGVDYKRASAGLFSRYCIPLFRPSIYQNQETFLEFLLELGKCFKTKPVLFLVDDPDLILSLKRQKELEPFYLFPLSGWNLVESIMDKGKLYQLCQRTGFPIPKTWWARSLEELDKQKQHIEYPCIVKPTFSDKFRTVFGVKAKLLHSYSELRPFFERTLESNIETIIQEWIPGNAENLYTFGAYCDRNLEPVATFTGRKIHQYPPDFGTARLAESLYYPELEALGRRFFKLTGFFGIGLIEFKKDPSGRLKLFEMNPRPGGWVEYLAANCGANIVLAAYLDTVGKLVKPCRSAKYGVKWVNLAEDMYYCLRGYHAFGYADRGLTFFEWVRVLQGCRLEAFFSWDDPLPALVRNVALIRQLYTTEKRLREVLHHGGRSGSSQEGFPSQCRSNRGVSPERSI